MVALAGDPAFVQEVYREFREAFDAADEVAVFVSNAEGAEFLAACPGASFGLSVDGYGAVRVEVSSGGRTAATRKANLVTVTAPGPFRLKKDYAVYSANLYAPSFEWYFHTLTFQLLKKDSEVPTLSAEFASHGCETEGLRITVYIEEPTLACYAFFQYWELDDTGVRQSWSGLSRKTPLKRLARGREKGAQA